jgi:hypothetical protein
MVTDKVLEDGIPDHGQVALHANLDRTTTVARIEVLDPKNRGEVLDTNTDCTTHGGTETVNCIFS